MGNDLTNIGTSASGSNTDNGVFQINERLTWLKGRHTMKFGGSWNSLHHGALLRRQQRASSGSSRLPTARSPARRSPTSCSIRCASKGRGSLTEPWTHLQNRIAFYAADDFKVTDNLTLNLGLRWGYTSPLVEKDDRQANFDLTQRRAAAGRPERQQPRALRAVLQGLGAAPRRSPTARATAGCSAAATASRSTWKAPAPTCACR